MNRQRGDNMVFEESSAEGTFRLGKSLGRMLKGGEIITLNGDLGTGKTEFTKGIAAGLDIDDYIVSPTFTILNEYEGRLKLNHFDVYRVYDPMEIKSIGFDEYIFGDGVSVIEWSDLISDIIPDNIIDIRLYKDLSRGLDFRKIVIEDKNNKLNLKELL